MKKTSLASDGEISLGTRNGHTSKNHSKHKKKEDNEERPLTEDELAEREERRREKKNEKRAKKMAEQLEALGLDENGDPLDNFCLSKYPVREWIFKLPHSVEPVALNPVVTLIGVAVLWGVFIWSSGKKLLL